MSNSEHDPLPKEDWNSSSRQQNRLSSYTDQDHGRRPMPGPGDSLRSHEGSHRSSKVKNLASGFEGKESQFKKYQPSEQEAQYEPSGIPAQKGSSYGPLINDQSGYYQQQQQMVRTTAHEAKPQFEATPDIGTNLSQTGAPKGKKGKKKKKKHGGHTQDPIPNEVVPPEFRGGQFTDARGTPQQPKASDFYPAASQKIESHMSEFHSGAPGYPSGHQPQSNYMPDAQSAHTNLVSKSYYQEEGGMISHPESQHYQPKPHVPQSQQQYIEMVEMQNRKAHNQSNPRSHPQQQLLQLDRPHEPRNADQESNTSHRLNQKLTEEEENQRRMLQEAMQNASVSQSRYPDDSAYSARRGDKQQNYNLEVIMSSSEYLRIHQQQEKIRKDQQKPINRLRRFIDNSFLGKIFCCSCCKMKDKTEKSWKEMNATERKYRIKRLWIKARLVYHFIRMKQSTNESRRRKKNDGNDDGDIDPDIINNSQEHVWKWYIIRQENTLPQLWSFLTNMLTIYALFATPFILVFSEFAPGLRAFEMFVDICFAMDILMNFFKLSANQKESEMKQYRIDYLKGLFLIDCVAALPGLATGEKGDNYFKLARFVHWNRFFDQLNLFVEKILMSWLGYTRQKVSEYVDFIKLELGVLLLTHIMAIIWISIGKFENGWVSAFIEEMRIKNDNPNLGSHDYYGEIYVNAFYFILTTITTVGYGDITGSTTAEYLFSMCVEFIGLTFFSFLTGTISVMFSGDQSFESLINARMEELDLWLLRLENCNKEEKIPNKLYHSIKEFIQDAFVYDFNLIIEEFSFYNELPASIQNQISESLFKTFKHQFNNFFLNTDIGFQHQLIVSMYCRIYEPGKVLVSYGQKITEMYFISKGSAVFFDQKGVTPFLQLPQYSFFGEYQLMFDLRSNFVVKVGGKEDYIQNTQKQHRTTFLCVSREIFERLFELFPKSKIVVQKRALERRKVFIEQLEKMEEFLKVKQQRMKQFQKSRMRQVRGADALKRVFSTDENAKLNWGDLKYLKQQQTPTDEGKNNDIQSEQSEDEDSEMSHQDEARDEHNINATTTTLTAFDDYDSKSMGQQMFHQSYLGQEVDPETEAREEYMRKLMSFRKDELVLADESDDFDEAEEAEGSKPQKEKGIQGVEDAYEIVENIEAKMQKISQVIRGIDKRMSYNLRLMGSVIMENNITNVLPDQATTPPGTTNQYLGEASPNSHSNEQVERILSTMPMVERKKKIIPKIKQMKEFTMQKLELTSDQDMENIENMKTKLQSIDQNEMKNKMLQKGLNSFVREQYMQDQNNLTMSIHQKQTSLPPGQPY